MIPTTIAAAASGLDRGDFSARELLSETLRRIGRTDHQVRAWLRLCPDRALQEADASDTRRAAGRTLGPLDGVPFGIKDIIDSEGVETTSGSDVLAGNVPARDATAVARLRAAGAIAVGKVNTHAFAYGVLTPPTRNPWNTDHVPSGSSGGSGASVAAAHVPLALGTDTGCSIRAPAAVCGITGLKPTFGRVPKDGVAVLSWSLDHVGPMAWTAEDAALTLNVLAGRSDRDSTSSRRPTEDFTRDLHRSLAGLRIGLPAGYFSSHFPAITAAVATAATTLQALGATLRPIASSPTVNGLPPHIPGLAIHFAEPPSWHAGRLRRQRDDYPPDVATFLQHGEVMLATDYINARRYRRRFGLEMRRFYDRHQVDLLITPTVPVTAGAAGQTDYRSDDGLVEDLVWASVRCAFPFNMTGQPALTVPCGFDDAGLPIGLQIAGRPWAESTVLRVGHAFQQATDWHTRRPALADAATADTV